MTPSIGRIVHYKLTAKDAEEVVRRRCADTAAPGWQPGAQAHTGQQHESEGVVFPLIVTRVWPDEYGPGTFGVNGQVILDGNDSLWVTSAKEGEGLGEWSWPAKVPG